MSAGELGISRNDGSLAVKAIVKVLRVPVDDDTHRLPGIKAARMGTSMLAMLRDCLLKILEEYGERAPEEAGSHHRARKEDEIMARFEAEAWASTPARV